MSNLIACQQGWSAVFAQLDGDGFTLEPVACWLYVDASHNMGDVRPVCALGGDVCDATQADNYVGVIGPGSDSTTAHNARTLVAAYRESRKNKPAA